MQIKIDEANAILTKDIFISKLAQVSLIFEARRTSLTTQTIRRCAPVLGSFGTKLLGVGCLLYKEIFWN